jgi:hypothetical protein
MRLSRKKCEDYLNWLGEGKEEKYIIGGKMRWSLYAKKKYGTCLRRHDPIAFEVYYCYWRGEHGG